jgi:hypothetical protein
VLPGLKSRISSTLVSVAKEHASYGEITESKACFIMSSVRISWLRSFFNQLHIEVMGFVLGITVDCKFAFTLL